MGKHIAIIVIACLITISVFGIKFESGADTFEVKGYLSTEVSYLSGSYSTNDMKNFYAGLGYSSLMMDLWHGSMFHFRYTFGIRSAFPNPYGGSNNTWISGMEAYGEYNPNDYISIKAGQVITPLGYLMPIHLMPALYPQVGPSIFFEEEMLPYNTTVDIRITIPLRGRMSIPINLFGGKPIANYGVRKINPAIGEVDVNNIYLFGIRAGYEWNDMLKAGYSFMASEQNLLYINMPYVAFDNDLLLIVAEASHKTYVKAVGKKSEASADILFGMHFGPVTPYINYEYMVVLRQEKEYRRCTVGVDWGVNDYLHLKMQYDYRRVFIQNSMTPVWLLRTSAVYIF
ncbi:MAG: hypothetical protein HZC28_16675 [Spirochaetes bacterium]|nr:hypothetical protein [Spirochaetota bacterium]